MKRLMIAALLLAGCATKPAEREIVTQRVEIPVEVARIPDPEMINCGNQVPIPVFEMLKVNGQDALVLMPNQQDNLQELLNSLKICVDAWRAWALSP